MNVKVELDHYYFKILIDEFPHIIIDKKEYIGFHSWFDSERECSIEFITKTNTILCEYDSKEKWLEILKALNDNL